MKRVKINQFQRGLVIKNGDFVKYLKPGVHWVWGSSTVNVYDTTKQFVAHINLQVVLQNTEIANELDVVDVAENELLLVYENGLLQAVFTKGRYAFWKSIIPIKLEKIDIGQVEIDLASDILQNALLAPFVRTFVVDNAEEGLLLVDGQFKRLLSPGVYNFWKNNTQLQVLKADARKQQLELNGQEILTKDKANIRISSFAQYKVVDTETALLKNKDFEKQLYALFQLKLREFVARFSLDELLQNKDAIAPWVLAQVKETTTNLGVEVFLFGIKDIILPGDIREIMNQVLVAEKKAQANVVNRREDAANTRAMLNTVKLMEENAMLWKLKEMEYVEKIADKIGEITINGNGQMIDQIKQIFVKT